MLDEVFVFLSNILHLAFVKNGTFILKKKGMITMSHTCTSQMRRTQAKRGLTLYQTTVEF